MQDRLGAGEEAEARRGEASLPLRPRNSRGWPLVQLPLWYLRTEYGIRYPHDRDLVDQSLTEVESPAPIQDNSPGQSINRSHHALQLLLYWLPIPPQIINARIFHVKTFTALSHMYACYSLYSQYYLLARCSCAEGSAYEYGHERLDDEPHSLEALAHKVHEMNATLPRTLP